MTLVKNSAHYGMLNTGWAFLATIVIFLGLHFMLQIWLTIVSVFLEWTSNSWKSFFVMGFIRCMCCMYVLHAGSRQSLPQGIPNQCVFLDNRVKAIHHSLLWNPAEAAEMYWPGGGRITDPASFGVDPLLDDNSKLLICSQAFRDCFPSFEPIFHNLVNGDDRVFRKGLKFYSDVTYRLSHS